MGSKRCVQLPRAFHCSSVMHLAEKIPEANSKNQNQKYYCHWPSTWNKQSQLISRIRRQIPLSDVMWSYQIRIWRYITSLHDLLLSWRCVKSSVRPYGIISFGPYVGDERRRWFRDTFPPVQRPSMMSSKLTSQTLLKKKMLRDSQDVRV